MTPEITLNDLLALLPHPWGDFLAEVGPVFQAPVASKSHQAKANEVFRELPPSIRPRR